MTAMFDTALKARYLTAGWNNALVGVLGAPILAYAVVALGTSAWSERAAFFGMVALGAVY